MKIRDITSNDLDFDNKKYCPINNLKQHSKGFSCRLDILRNANANGIVTFKSFITRKIFKNNFMTVF